MATGHELGRWGEAVAATYLTARGWVVLAKNYRDGPREVDLVARRGPVTAFVEVKTRTGSTEEALHCISWRKRRDVSRAAARWIRENPTEYGTFRFDVVLVQDRGGAEARVEHLTDAWRGGSA